MGGVMGLTTAFLMETWINVWGYPLNIAGRPLFSWPAFIIPAYEWTILFAGFSAAFGMIAMNGLPQLYHPLFNAPNFRNGATTDKFFLCLEAGDPKFSLTGDTGVSGAFCAGFCSGGGPLMQRSGNRVQESGTIMMKRVAMICGLSAMGLLAGCRQDMQDQPKFFPQRGTTFYADGRSVRPQVENTVARGQLHEDSYFNTGLIDGKEGDALPFPATMQVLARGQERYNVYCTPCHSRVGNGEGMIVQRGYAPAGNYHTLRLQAAPLGHFFNVMTKRLWRDAGLRGATAGGGPLGDRGLYQGAAVESECNRRGCSLGRACRVALEHCGDRGLPPEMAKDWTPPATVVHGTPDGGSYVLPATDKTTGSSSVTTTGKTAPATQAVPQ